MNKTSTVAWMSIILLVLVVSMIVIHFATRYTLQPDGTLKKSLFGRKAASTTAASANDDQTLID